MDFDVYPNLLRSAIVSLYLCKVKYFPSEPNPVYWIIYMLTEYITLK